MMSSNEMVEKEFFVESNYRKIRKNLIYQIAFARIKEITEILFKKISTCAITINQLKTFFLSVTTEYTFKALKEYLKLLF